MPAGEVRIETSRLILRTVKMEDAAGVVTAWKLDEGPVTLEEAEAQIRWMQGNHERNRHGQVEHLCLAAIEKVSGEIIGWCGLDHRDKTRENPVLFYLLKKRWWGLGLATEAAGALIRYALDEIGLERVDSACAVENIASKRVMEKIGMTYLGLDQEGGHMFTIGR